MENSGKTISRKGENDARCAHLPNLHGSRNWQNLTTVRSRNKLRKLRPDAEKLSDVQKTRQKNCQSLFAVPLENPSESVLPNLRT